MTLPHRRDPWAIRWYERLPAVWRWRDLRARRLERREIRREFEGVTLDDLDDQAGSPAKFAGCEEDRPSSGTERPLGRYGLAGKSGVLRRRGAGAESYPDEDRP